MRALNPREVRDRLVTIGEDIPLLVTQYVAYHPGCRWERPVVAVTRAVSPPLEFNEAEQIVIDCIQWFVRRSDFYLARGRRLWPSPPTLVWSHANERTQGVFIGGTGLGRVKEIAARFGANLREVRVLHRHGRGLIGIHHSLQLSTDKLDSLRLHAADDGIANIEATELASDLPSVRDLLRPAAGRSTFDDYPRGTWEHYTPHRGWSEVDEMGPSDVLLRFSVDLDGRKSFRHFLQASNGSITEISWDEASMWQFSLDAETGGTTALNSGASLLLEHRLPPTFSFWMSALGCWPGRYDPDTGLYSYEVPAEARSEVFAGLKERLAIDVSEGGST